MIPTTGEKRQEWLNSLWPDKLDLNHAQIRECFKTELAAYIDGSDPDYYENLYQAALYLFVIGDPSDAVLMFDAKMASFDLGCGIDFQFILGAGFEKTIDYAKESSRSDMVRYLNSLKGDPDLNELAEWLKFRINYFRLPTQQREINPTHPRSRICSNKRHDS